MASTYLRAEKIAAQALGLLERELVLANTVTRMGRTDVQYAQDDTVNLRIPARVDARERAVRATTQLSTDELTETSIAVVLDKHVYSLVPVTDAQLTLDIVSFGEQVQRPQMRGVAEKLEGYVQDALSGATYAVGHTQEFNTGDPFASFIKARKLLNDANVPMSDRFFAVGSQIEAEILADDRVTAADSFGTDSAFREATIGRLFGFTIVSSNTLGENEAYAYHRSAVVLPVVAPEVPSGATAGSQASMDGLAMTWLRDYDPDYAQDRSLVHSFAGYKAVDDGTGSKVVRAVKFVNSLTS